MCVVDCVLNLIARHVSWCVRARVSFSLCVRKCVCVYSTLIISSYTLDRKLIWHESKIKLKTKWKTQLLKHKHTFLFHIYIEHLSSHLPPHTQTIYTQWYLLHLARLLNKSYLFSMFELNYKSDILTMVRWLLSFFPILLFFLDRRVLRSV